MNYHQLAENHIEQRPGYTAHIIMISSEFMILNSFDYLPENSHIMPLQLVKMDPENYKLVFSGTVRDRHISIYMVGFWGGIGFRV